jgi:hypothetical protein
MLELNGIPSAYADYQVVSPARLLATIVPTAGGDILSVVGSCFLAYTGLAVMLVPLDGRMHPRVEGTVVTSASGRLSFRRRLRRQPFGQYLLEVFSVDGRSAQTATTPLQIVG